VGLTAEVARAVVDSVIIIIIIINNNGAIEANSIGMMNGMIVRAEASASKPVVRFRKADAARWQQIGLQC
jgi:hypothetical protein